MVQEEPLAAEVEARVRQEAEREALKQIAIQEGERLPDVDEEAALAEEGADEPLDDYDDGEVCISSCAAQSCGHKLKTCTFSGCTPCVEHWS